MSKQRLATLMISIALAIGTTFSAGTNAAELKMVLGGHLSMGFAFVAGDGYEDWTPWDRDDRTAKFSVGGGGYFDLFFHRYVGIEVGMGFLNKGIRFSDGDVVHKQSLVYMELPVMAKIDIHHFQAAFGLALSVALSGKQTDKNDNTEREERWDGDDWDNVHRVNLGPKIVLGYAIPVGPIFIVPGMSWTMHLINDLNNEEIGEGWREEPDYAMRAVNLMFNVAVEWVIP